MELKNAIAICLITFFSASVVVLIVRVIDMRSNAAVEAKLDRVIEELEAIRAGGGIASGTGNASAETLDSGLMVYYFHGNVRCPTCESIESQSYDEVHKDFASQLQSKAMVWKILNYEEPENAELTTKFKVQMPVVVLADMKDGEIADWRRLDQVWALYTEPEQFAEYIKSNINEMLPQANASPQTNTGETATQPTANEDAPLPLPTEIELDLPLPGAEPPVQDETTVPETPMGATPLPLPGQ